MKKLLIVITIITLSLPLLGRTKFVEAESADKKIEFKIPENWKMVSKNRWEYKKLDASFYIEKIKPFEDVKKKLNSIVSNLKKKHPNYKKKVERIFTGKLLKGGSVRGVFVFSKGKEIMLQKVLIQGTDEGYIATFKMPHLSYYEHRYLNKIFGSIKWNKESGNKVTIDKISLWIPSNWKRRGKIWLDGETDTTFRVSIENRSIKKFKDLEIALKQLQNKVKRTKNFTLEAAEYRKINRKKGGFVLGNQKTKGGDLTIYHLLIPVGDETYHITLKTSRINFRNSKSTFRKIFSSIKF